MAEVFDVSSDVGRFARCIPGATLESSDSGQFAGRVKVHVGPEAVSHKGAAKCVDQDSAAHRAVLEAVGREVGGNGTAKATLVMMVHDHGSMSKVEISTDLAITGKVAKFGRSVIVDVAGRLVGEFAHNLLNELTRGDDDQPAAEAGTAGAGGAHAQVGSGASAFQLVSWPARSASSLKWLAVPAALLMLLAGCLHSGRSGRRDRDGARSAECGTGRHAKGGR